MFGGTLLSISIFLSLKVLHFTYFVIFQNSVAKDLSRCKLSDFNEGRIGKLQIRKSGKVELCLGNVTLDLTMGTSPSFLQVRRGERGGGGE